MHLGECGHLIIHHDCSTCIAIQNEYYQKLKMTGWVDIEDTTHPERPLLCWHALKSKKISPATKEQVENYYEKARELLHIYRFQSDVQRQIWQLHSDGLSQEKIEIAIKDAPTPYKREYIRIIINQIKEEMIK